MSLYSRANKNTPDAEALKLAQEKLLDRQKVLDVYYEAANNRISSEDLSNISRAAWAYRDKYQLGDSVTEWVKFIRENGLLPEMIDDYATQLP